MVGFATLPADLNSLIAATGAEVKASAALGV